jgi:hypothetical protein
MRLKIRIFPLATLLMILIAGFGGAATAGAVGDVGGRPALPREDEPRSQSIFIHTIKQGQTIDDKVLVANRSDKEQTVLVYAVDATPTNTGSFSCKQRVEKLEDAGGWIKLAANEVTLGPGKSDIVDFTITAPAKADVGEHNACIAFEAKEDEGEVSGNLRIRTRSAVRVALTIPGQLHREVGVDSYKVAQEGSLQRYTLTLKNVGNVSADTKVDVRLRTLFGGTAYQNGGEYPVLSGNKLELSYENNKPPFFGGWFFAQASAAYNPDSATWGTKATENLKTVYAQNQLIFVWPQPLGGIILLLAVGLVVWGVYRLIKQEGERQEVIKSWKSYTVKQGDTVASLAQNTKTDWKRIAAINRLKAPYALTPGTILYVPKVKTKTPAEGKSTKTSKT